MRTLYITARYLAAVLIIFYAFAKLNGAQFTVIDSQLDTPMGLVAPFWLAWYFFGYSPLYGTFIALAQLLAGVLLFFPRTTLLGACILAPVMANIVLIDLSYDVGGGLPTALPALYTVWVANVNNRAPTPIDGAWDVASATGSADLPTAIFFEYNRAYLDLTPRDVGPRGYRAVSAGEGEAQ